MNLPGNASSGSASPAFGRAKWAVLIPVVIVILAALFVIVMWLAGLPGFARATIHMETVNMVALSCILLAAVSVLLLVYRPGRFNWRLVCKLFALLMLLCGGARLLELAGGVDLKLDTILFYGYYLRSVSDPYTGRMTYVTALVILLLGMALLLKATGNKRPLLSEALLLFLLVISLFNIISIIYGVKEEYFGAWAMYKLRLGAAVSSLLLSFALLVVDRRQGIIGIITSKEPGGKMATIFLPLVLLFPVLLGIIDRVAETSGKYQDAFGLALFSVIIMIIFFVVILRTARVNNIIYRQLLNEVQEREKAAKEAYASDVFANTIYENIPHMVFVKDGRDLTFKSINKSGEQLLGITREELIGKSDYDFFPKEQADFFTTQDSQLFINGSSPVVEEPIATQSHGVRWLRTRKIGVKDTDGTPLYMIGISEDITELKEKQEQLNRYNAELEQEIRKRTKELRKSEERYQQMVEDVLDYSVLLVDRDGIVLNWNKGAERMSGYRAEEIIGHHFRVFYNAEDKQAGIPDAFLEKARATGRASHEGWSIKKDGQLLWVVTAITALYDEDGAISGFSKVTRDITERRRAEEKLKESQQQFEAFMGMLPAMTWIVDEQGVFQYTNLLYQRIFELGTITGKRFQDVFPAEIATEYERNNEIVFKSNITLETTEPSVKPDGTRSILKVFKFPLGERNGMRLLGGIAVDITQMVETKEALHKLNEQLIASNKELEQFAFVASHDLQEPLRMISSFLQLLQLKYRNRIDETANQYIHFAVDASERMKAFITDLLRFSKLGGTEEAFGCVDCSRVMENVLKVCYRMIEESGATVHVPALPVIRGRTTQLEQLFFNLISNGIKYRGSKKTEIHIGYEEHEKEWQFYVKDNGIGIDSKYLEKIFVIFQRLHNKKDYSGTGIGLAICKKIVEQHGGKIWLTSVPGEGSTFYFTVSKNN